MESMQDQEGGRKLAQQPLQSRDGNSKPAAYGSVMTGVDQMNFVRNDFPQNSFQSQMRQFTAEPVRPREDGRFNPSSFDARIQNVQANPGVYGFQNFAAQREPQRNFMEEAKFGYAGTPNVEPSQPTAACEMQAAEDADEQNTDRNQEESSYGKTATQKGPKGKRGRKRKVKEGQDGSTESDADVFNYDKFIKRVSKKGTRVHMNIRMFANRTVVPGTTVLKQTNPKMAMGIKDDENPNNAANQIQKYSKTKINEIRKSSQLETPKAAPPKEEPAPVPAPARKETTKKSSGNNFLHQGEDFYNVEGYDVGRYNLRKRGPQKKYYDDDPEFDDDLNIPMKSKDPYDEDEFRQVARAPPPGRRRNAEESYQSKSKRKKKDDDEDYVEEEDEDPEDQEDFSESKKKEARMANEAMNSFNPGGAPQFGGMPQNKMMNPYQMQNQFQSQNQNQKWPMMGMQGKMPPYPMMQQNMPMNMQNRGSPPIPGMQPIMPPTNSMAYMMNNQNKAAMGGDASKGMKFPPGMPMMQMPMMQMPMMPMQQPNMAYMMRMNNPGQSMMQGPGQPQPMMQGGNQPPR